MHIGRAGKCVDDDDDDSGGRTQRDCLTLAAPDRKVSSSRPRQRQIQFEMANTARPRCAMENLRKFGKFEKN